MMCHAGFGGVDAESGEYTCFLETFAGGYGGRAASDGPDAVQTHGQNTENAPVEETELNYPVRVTRLSLVEDSEGAGPLPRRARAAQGLPLRPADDLHRARRPDACAARGRVRRADGGSPSTCSCATARSGGWPRRRRSSSRPATPSATARAAAAATARRRSATRSASRATCSRARSRARARAGGLRHRRSEADVSMDRSPSR